MVLKQYLVKNMITYRAFSKMVEIDSAQIARYANGLRLPNLRNALKIFKATKKQVALEDWFKPIPEKK